MKISRNVLTLRYALAIVAGIFAWAALNPAAAEEATSQPAAERQGEIYPLDTCPISGSKLGTMGDPVIYLHEGREIRFCCEGCIPKFKRSPISAIEKIDAAITEAQKADYPLDVCIVSGDKLSKNVHKGFRPVIGNRYFLLCCGGCIGKVKADLPKYLDILDKAVIEKNKDSYPLDTCLVTDDKIGGEMGDPIDYVYNGQLVRFCCTMCVRDFEKDPQKYLKKLNEKEESDDGDY